ncbi:deoxyribonuclease IV [Hydrogenobacter hydrogenophilus]|uniref:Probable endonuclease 4 n=1 Tax=Hydrogenobacter hydrogenophilus TaxID=35835 RepID=A0A285NVA9_9AQUI|nr:deoxyribonuclease IV [Hydrogenobacter hydrogenophilus]SNZ13410.1 Endonuclease IV [Hydrogenobacter hydrogenophilus]
MPRLGVHVSSAGSIINTFERAKQVGAEVFQFFLRSPRAWKAKDISPEEVETFKKLKKSWDYIMVHAPYLLNLASQDDSLRKKSVEVFLEELKLCDLLGVDYYNFHPGTAKGISDEEGIRNIIRSLEEVFSTYTPKHTCVLFENTAGEKGDLGKNFEELKKLIEPFKDLKVGVCIDTCHAFAYGYAINTAEGFNAFKKEAESTVGIESIKAVHCNDSKVPLGGKKDRHEHIGLGYMGTQAFRLFLKDPYFSNLPYYLETPKEDDWDRKNLQTLRSIL